MIHRFILLLMATVISSNAVAVVYEIPDEQTQVIGNNLVVYTQAKDTLLDIARHFDLGYGDIVNANPDVDPWVPGDNQRVLVPAKYILPATEHQGVVINIPEMRLYYYPPKQAGKRQQVVTHPLGIGREGRDTPLGKLKIIQKRENPSWTPPESVRREHAAEGDILPAVVPPGPDNPLGTRAMRLSNPSYLIHGTHRPYGVGLRVSSGCIRLYPEDIESLYERISLQTQVNIIYAPYKAGMANNQLYIEAHKPLDDLDQRDASNTTPLVKAILALDAELPAGEQWTHAEKIVLDANGVTQQPNMSDSGFADQVWFLHAGTGSNVSAKMQSAIQQLQLQNWFWPIRGGAIGEVVLGPFENREQAQAMADKVAIAAQTRVWLAQLPESML
ncbi:ErfK/YbiS/YcfS/YnhG family protein [Methylophaga frappieri]|uniref:ErfK/YbiS/YcfS/YnhG family protein n=1 Tax=Methylophaga frappieri (strain ATCC BAA-2434 / DSM 25690 / JAM7) TaxID=754477 RepID=I1YFC1_METFJ|nr:L,D-transpeptidase family protein [Methylophaga frappieri]AFJ01614.1 ErfK/YbiS/YcfS/YnhG family protein [Methylophaga frappieri]